MSRARALVSEKGVSVVYTSPTARYGIGERSGYTRATSPSQSAKEKSAGNPAL